MARISRVVASGYPHHVTQRGVRSIPIFQTEIDRRVYFDFMAEDLNHFGVEVLAWCLPERRFGEEQKSAGTRRRLGQVSQG
jgi:putative transposase